MKTLGCKTYDSYLEQQVQLHINATEKNYPTPIRQYTFTATTFESNFRLRRNPYFVCSFFLQEGQNPNQWDVDTFNLHTFYDDFVTQHTLPKEFSGLEQYVATRFRELEIGLQVRKKKSAMLTKSNNPEMIEFYNGIEAVLGYFILHGIYPIPRKKMVSSPTTFNSPSIEHLTSEQATYNGDYIRRLAQGKLVDPRKMWDR